MIKIKLILGLGNPGPKYIKTRHNIGFRAISHLAKNFGFNDSSRHSYSLVIEGTYARERVILARPLTFMNRSGLALLSLQRRYSIPLSDILIIYDDMDLEVGCIRIRKRGGDGGHQGLGSIIRAFNSFDVPRLRVGIGRPPLGVEPREYVLDPFSYEEEKEMEGVFNRLQGAVEVRIIEGIDTAMNSYN